uniref:Uncharacterized protein n=1 Tax=Rhinolophus ferrumequinum TaxID=59479 RepID=A0A671DIL5_RHIFE
NNNYKFTFGAGTTVTVRASK